MLDEVIWTSGNEPLTLGHRQCFGRLDVKHKSQHDASESRQSFTGVDWEYGKPQDIGNQRQAEPEPRGVAEPMSNALFLS